MIQTELTLQNARGIHTRSAAKLVDLAKHFSSKIDVVFNDRVADCKNIMNVITLGAQKNNRVTFLIDGEDEREATDAITKLIQDKFGEE